MTHHQIALVLFLVSAALFVIEWLLLLAKRDGQAFRLLAFAAADRERE